MASPVRKLPKLNGSLQVIPVKRRSTCCTYMEFQCSLNWFYRERQSFPWPLVQNIMTSCAMFQFDFSSAFKARGMFVKKWSKISPCSPRIFSHVSTTQLERSHQKAIKMKKLWRSPWHSQSSSYKTGKRAPTKFSLHLTQAWQVSPYDLAQSRKPRPLQYTYDEYQSQSANVLTLLWKRAHQDDSNDTPLPISELQVSFPLLRIRMNKD